MGMGARRSESYLWGRGGSFFLSGVMGEAQTVNANELLGLALVVGALRRPAYIQTNSPRTNNSLQGPSLPSSLLPLPLPLLTYLHVLPYSFIYLHVEYPPSRPYSKGLIQENQNQKPKPTTINVIVIIHHHHHPVPITISYFF